MKKQRTIRITYGIWGLLAVLWMIQIFRFSARPAEVSAQQSSSVGMMICTVMVKGYSDLSVHEQLAYAGKIDHIVRKSAHFTEYMMLSLLLYLTFGFVENQWKRMCFAWCIAAAYAATDELHQRFVPGRSGELRDVLLDAVGAFTMLAVIWMGTLVVRVLRQKRHQEGEA